MRRLIALCAAVLLAGCGTPGAQTVAVDVKTADKPVSVGCLIEWPKPPIPYVALVQLTGDPKRDLVAIERAKEAELEAHRAYRIKLEAAARACVKNPAPT